MNCSTVWMRRTGSAHSHGLKRSGRSKLPWVLATHRTEDMPASATHALVLSRGRVVYRGVLARAPLARWLESKKSGAVRRVRIPKAFSPRRSCD